MIAILEGFPKWTDGKFVFDHITRAKTYNRLEDADFVNGTLIGRLPPRCLSLIAKFIDQAVEC
jgi:hypothetical protein